MILLISNYCEISAFHFFYSELKYVIKISYTTYIIYKF